MSGEEGPLKRSMVAVEEVVPGQLGPILKPCTPKRKVGEEAAPPPPAGLQSTLAGCTIKKGAVEEVAAVCSEGENATGTAEVAAFTEDAERYANEVERSPEKMMIRLPQEEVDYILAQEFRAPSDFEALRRSNPDLTPPPDEEMDESTKLLYDAAAIFYAGQESFFKFQEQVRQQFKEKGFVDLDHDYVATRAYNRALILETWEEVCGSCAYLDEDDECVYSDTGYEESDDKSVSVMED
uniref:Uncharacterized protein n=1 Tax=Arundo donax TaxID=35708 RepID=A0A0A9BXD6_ARUDO